MAGSLDEIGRSGLIQANGVVNEEFLARLRGAAGHRTYREMADNEPVLGGILLAFEKMIGRLDWHIEAAEDADDAEHEDADFVQGCLDDMSESWSSTVSNIMSMAVYGWSFHEIVYKRRGGPTTNDPKSRSRFSDGKIGWRKWPIRSQDSLYRWLFDEEGGIQGMSQLVPDGSPFRDISIQKALLFRTSTNKGNPEGRSLLRNAYRPWHYKKRIEEIEAVGIERDLAGLPVGWIPPAYFATNATVEEKNLFLTLQTLVTRVKRNEAEGVILPNVRDENGHRLIEFELMSTGGTRQFDTDKTITRYSQQMAMSLLADFLMLGHENVGSFALGASKIDLWIMAVEAIAKSIAEVVNSHAIPRLLKLNGRSPERMPELVFGSVETVDLNTLGTFIKTLAEAGVLKPDDTFEEHVRALAKFPPIDREAEEREDQGAGGTTGDPLFPVPDPEEPFPVEGA